jgi:hypothetical protein
MGEEAFTVGKDRIVPIPNPVIPEDERRGALSDVLSIVGLDQWDADDVVIFANYIHTGERP